MGRHPGGEGGPRCRPCLIHHSMQPAGRGSQEMRRSGMVARGSRTGKRFLYRKRRVLHAPDTHASRPAFRDGRVRAGRHQPRGSAGAGGAPLLALCRPGVPHRGLLRRHPCPHGAVGRRRRRRHATPPARRLPLRPGRAGRVEHRPAREAVAAVRLLHDHRPLGRDGRNHRHHRRCAQHHGRRPGPPVPRGVRARGGPPRSRRPSR